MFLFLFREDSEEKPHVIKIGKDSDEEIRNVPRKKCRQCSDLAYCDLDFCLRWFH